MPSQPGGMTFRPTTGPPYRLVRVPGTERAAVESETTLELAVSAGVPLPDGRVLVADGVAVSLVDLVSGRRLGEVRDVAPPRFRCEALSADEEGMVACYGPRRALVVVSHAVGPQPRIEMQVASRGTVGRPGDEDDEMLNPLPDATASLPVSYGAGMLLVGATCAGVEEPGVVCVFHRGGQWVQSDERSLVRAMGGKPWRVEFWVPREDGGIVRRRWGAQPTSEAGETLHARSGPQEFCDGRKLRGRHAGKASMRPRLRGSAKNCNDAQNFLMFAFAPMLRPADSTERAIPDGRLLASMAHPTALACTALFGAASG